VHLGDPALLFSLPALNEEAAMRAVARPSVSLSDFTGVGPAFPAAAVVLHFLEQADGAPQLEALGRLNKRYAPRNVRFVAVLAEGGDLAAASDWVQGLRLEFPVLRDAHGIVVSRYGIQSFPMTFVVDTYGDVVAVGQATAKLESDLDAVLAPLAEK
jgi:peroxiredoxin